MHIVTVVLPDVVQVRKKSNIFTLDRHREEVKLPPVLSIQVYRCLL